MAKRRRPRKAAVPQKSAASSGSPARLRPIRAGARGARRVLHARRRRGAGVERAGFGYGAAEQSTAARRPDQPGRVRPSPFSWRASGPSVDLSCCCHASATRNSSGHSLDRRGLQALVVFVAVLLYGSSWALFWNTGVFFDRQAFAFLALNGLQIYHWVYPPLAVAVLVATLVGSAVLGWWVPSWTPSRRAGRATATCPGGGRRAWHLGRRGARRQGRRTRRKRPNAINPKLTTTVSRDDRAGPVAHAFADIARGSGAEAPAVASTDNANVIRRPIISMDQYLAGVPRNGIKRWNVVMVQIESLRSDQLRAVWRNTRRHADD